MKIVVAGTGYVGLSIASLLSQHNEVVAVDVIPEKVDLINQRRFPIQGEYIEKNLTEKNLNLETPNFKVMLWFIIRKQKFLAPVSSSISILKCLDKMSIIAPNSH